MARWVLGSLTFWELVITCGKILGPMDWEKWVLLRTKPFTEEQREQIFLQAGFNDWPRAVKKKMNIIKYLLK